MSTIDELVEANAEWSAQRPASDLEAPPARAVAVVTCMDARIDPAAALGLAPGDAHVIRNAGGAVTPDVLRSLAISQRKLGTREVAVIAHTRCGMQTLTDDGFRSELLEEVGMAPTWAVESFADLDLQVAQSVRRVRASDFLAHRDAVRGFVYDVETGGLREVQVDG